MIEELKSMGVNVDEALDRVMGDTDLYGMMLGMFLSSLAENPVEPGDFDGGNLDDVIRRVHTLKGVTGNLGITPLFNGYNEMLGQLRGGQAREAKATFERIQPIQTKVVECIKRHQGA